MRRRKCKGNYVFTVKFILSRCMCCRLIVSYNSTYINSIQEITTHLASELIAGGYIAAHDEGVCLRFVHIHHAPSH